MRLKPIICLLAGFCAWSDIPRRIPCPDGLASLHGKPGSRLVRKHCDCGFATRCEDHRARRRFVKHKARWAAGRGPGGRVAAGNATLGWRLNKSLNLELPWCTLCSTAHPPNHEARTSAV